MNVIFKNITKNDFIRLHEAILFSNPKDENYGKITIEDKIFKFSWKSDLVSPIIKEVNSSIIGVGIDLNFVMIDYKKNEILIDLLLENYFMDFILYKGCLYVATELNVKKIDLINYNIIAEYYLPEIFTDFIVNDFNLQVTCIDNQVVFIEN